MGAPVRGGRTASYPGHHLPPSHPVAPGGPLEPLTTAMLATGASVLVLGPSVLLWARTVQRRTRAIQQAGARTGLLALDDHHLRGKPRGLQVQATDAWGGWRVRVELRHPVAGIDGLRDDPRVRRLLQRAEELSAGQQLASTHLTLTGVHPGNLEPTVVAAVDLGLALQDAYDLPLATWCRVEGLELDRSPADCRRRAHGRWHDRPLELCLVGGAHDARAVLRLPAAGPPELQVRRRQDAPEAPRLGDPFLDRLVAVEGADSDAARALLADGERMAPLLELVAGHPGSRVHGSGVELVLEGQLRDPAAAAALAVEAAEALEG